MTPAHELDGLVEEMLTVAGLVAICVRDRDADGVRDALIPVLDGDRDRVAALIIALGALVPDDQPYSQLLAWTHGQDQLPLGQLIIDPLEKWCPSCQQVRSRLVDFHRDASRRDGLYNRCRHCVSEEYQARKQRTERDGREAVA